MPEDGGMESEVLYCTPERLQARHQDEGLRYFWWYKRCHDSEEECFKTYKVGSGVGARTVV